MQSIDCVPTRSENHPNYQLQSKNAFTGDLHMLFYCQLWAPSPFTHPHREVEAISYTHCK